MGLRELEEVWDGLPAAEAVARAWRDPGPRHGSWHKHARRDVGDLMPLLARALDRLLLELLDQLPPTDEAVWEPEPALATVACADVSCRCGHLGKRHAAGGLYGERCRARDCPCARFVCSCRGRRECERVPSRVR